MRLWCVLNFVTTARPVGTRIRWEDRDARRGRFLASLRCPKNRLFAPLAPSAVRV